MTQSGHQWSKAGDPDDFFDSRSTQGHLLIVRVFDKPQYYRTSNCTDGMVYPNPQRNQNFEPFPNSVIRGAVADLQQPGDDGLPGKVWDLGIFYASSLLKPMTGMVGKLNLVVLRQKDPTDKSSPYSIFDMTENPEATAMADEFLARHPEFLTIAPPPAYDGHEPAPKAPQAPPQQQYPAQQPQWQPQGPPPQWNQQPGVQQYPPAQPQWAPQQPQQPPAQWNTAAPPPGYYQQQPQPAPQPQQNAGQWGPVQQYIQDPWPQQQQGPPPAQPPQQQTFLQGMQQGQQGPPPQYNAQGQPQQQEPPF